MPFIGETSIRTGASSAGGYTIDQSIRFDDNDSAYLSRTPGAADSDLTRATVSVWYKRGVLGTKQTIFSAGVSSNATWFGFLDTDVLGFFQVASSSTVASISTNAVFRDPSAWYHIVCTYDSNEAASADRVTITVNGIEQSVSTATAISSGRALDWNSTDAHSIGRRQSSATEYCDGYMAEFVNIPATALAATSFGEYNDDGVWIPKAYEGTYGTNGFYITGADSADLGADESGNGNDFTSSGLTASDQVPDSPTDNYCVISPLTGVNSGSSVVTQANGNLEATMTANYVGTFGTLGVNSGKYYFEYSYAADGNYNDGRLSGGVVCVETADHGHFRIDGGSFYVPDRTTEGNYMIHHLNGSGQLSNTGTSRIAYNTSLSSASATGGPESGPDIYMVALDLDNNNIYWGKNGTWYGSGGTSGSAYTDATPAGILSTHQGKYFAPAFWFNGATSGTTTVLNCGQDATFGGRYSSPAGDFYYTPPTGFSALSTANLPTPAIADGSAHFYTNAYTGTGVSGTSITNDANAGDFKPDFFWVKPRSEADNNVVLDSVRGETSRIYPNKTDAQDTDPTALITFEANGFDLDTTDRNYNQSGSTYVAWQWHTTGGTSGSNTDGTITSTVSANQTAGFSIVSYTGNGTAGATVGHGLGVAPDMLIVKNRENTEQWIVYHQYNGGTKYLLLNSNAAVATSSGAWNNTDPSSTVVTLGGGGFGTNVSGDDMIMYAFAEVEGFSKIGNYTGNGSTNGPFVWCGFRPAFVIVKRTDAANDWCIADSARPAFNPAYNLRANLTVAEDTTQYNTDLVSNGFKIKNTTNGMNGSGASYIFMAFAEHPFGGDGVAPVPAR